MEKELGCHNIAAKEWKKLDSHGTENFLHDIIFEKWVQRPKGVSFTFARYIWKMDDANI